MKAVVKFEISVPVKIFYSECAYIAQCPVFDVATQGKTEEDAKNNIIDALTAFLLTCFDMGTLAEVLKKCGFRPTKTVPEPDQDDINFVNIPLPFMIPENSEAACHA